MFGLFFEDINYAADGGLYAEMLETGILNFRNPGGTMIITARISTGCMAGAPAAARESWHWIRRSRKTK